MYQLLRGHSFKEIFTHDLPPFAASFVIAELFYKWHSFSLECAGFLVTWFVLDWAWTKAKGGLSAAEAEGN